MRKQCAQDKRNQDASLSRDLEVVFGGNRSWLFHGSSGELGHVLTLGDADYDGVLGSLRCIVVVQLGPQTPRLTAHDCVGLRIIVRQTAEDGHSDGGLFEMLRITVKRCLNQEVEKLYQLLGPSDRLARPNSLESAPYL